ncbi:IPT/TIG domain-containing protein [Xanthomarina sp. F1114]|uniref:IPT/TIG domain-containing protein n=1 Tax=Xanthomarina sp. F1114 TaxID=2996019 RepID=UPI00225E5873|nr:IPT/TIG domain-containing protein [Xanthomarina sp. F1114]MCX7546893.1 IPT/TIG domain-containing protein [Xanthomarina sp. F1114]
MKYLKTTLKPLILILAMAFAVTSCSSDDDTPTQPTPTATVNNISPVSGPKGTVVTISGNHFGSNTNNIKVFFNNMEAAVQTVSNTEITVTVPPRAYTGMVKVMVNSTEIIAHEFEYIISEFQVSTFAGSTNGFADGTGIDAQFDYPRGITIDNAGNFYITDTGNHKIRKINPNGTVSTIAGSIEGDADGTGTNAQFNAPEGIAIDSQGNLYIADRDNNKIRKITPNGAVTTLAGNTAGYADGTGADAQFYGPTGITVDNQDNLYVADNNNNKIRKVTQNGVVSTVAGNNSGDTDGTGTNAQFNGPQEITADSQGNLYIADSGNHKIRKINSSGEVSTIAGSIEGNADGTGIDAQFATPLGITLDSQGNLYIADSYNHRIRKITPSGLVSTIAGSSPGYTDGTGASAQFYFPLKIIIDSQDNLYVSDRNNNKIRKITPE